MSNRNYFLKRNSCNIYQTMQIFLSKCEFIVIFFLFIYFNFLLIKTAKYFVNYFLKLIFSKYLHIIMF